MSYFRPVEPADFDSFTTVQQRMLCKAVSFGKFMQVNADSFLPNQRFNLAMGLASIHVGQYFRKFWTSGKKVGKLRPHFVLFCQINFVVRENCFSSFN